MNFFSGDDYGQYFCGFSVIDEEPILLSGYLVEKYGTVSFAAWDDENNVYYLWGEDVIGIYDIPKNQAKYAGNLTTPTFTDKYTDVMAFAYDYGQ